MAFLQQVETLSSPAYAGMTVTLWWKSGLSHSLLSLRGANGEEAILRLLVLKPKAD
jgi:hypothetical protein